MRNQEYARPVFLVVQSVYTGVFKEKIKEAEEKGYVKFGSAFLDKVTVVYCQFMTSYVVSSDMLMPIDIDKLGV